MESRPASDSGSPELILQQRYTSSENGICGKRHVCQGDCQAWMALRLRYIEEMECIGLLSREHAPLHACHTSTWWLLLSQESAAKERVYCRLAFKALETAVTLLLDRLWSTNDLPFMADMEEIARYGAEDVCSSLDSDFWPSTIDGLPVTVGRTEPLCRRKLAVSKCLFYPAFHQQVRKRMQRHVNWLQNSWAVKPSSLLAKFASARLEHMAVIEKPGEAGYRTSNDVFPASAFHESIRPCPKWAARPHSTG